jgi:regulator of cell morphogenesis and NO signaling
MSISPESTVRDIASEHPSTTRVFEKAGIDYCCGGARSLQEACDSKNLNVEDLLARLRQAEAEPLPADLRDWKAAPLSDVADHIVQRHHEYVRSESPRVQGLIEKVISRHGDTQPHLDAVRKRFEKLSGDMSTHMMKEEQVLFPYISRMEAAVNAGKPVPPPFFGTVQNPVRAMMNEHDDAGELAREIRELTSDYTPPASACPTYRAMLTGLHDFEQDLHRHVHLENNILFPRAVQLEQGS